MKQVELYTTPWCGYCMAAKRLLDKKGVPYVEIDVSGDPARRQEMLTRARNRYTVPQIFVGDTHVGGFTELAELHRAGRLDTLLKA